VRMAAGCTVIVMMMRMRALSGLGHRIVLA
jgi:hypothetical protein